MIPSHKAQPPSTLNQEGEALPVGSMLIVSFDRELLLSDYQDQHPETWYDERVDYETEQHLSNEIHRLQAWFKDHPFPNFTERKL